MPPTRAQHQAFLAPSPRRDDFLGKRETDRAGRPARFTHDLHMMIASLLYHYCSCTKYTLHALINLLLKRSTISRYHVVTFERASDSQNRDAPWHSDSPPPPGQKHLWDNGQPMRNLLPCPYPIPPQREQIDIWCNPKRA
jgi:hypothetical protein